MNNINPQEIKWVKQIGKGSFGEVFEIVYMGEKYAAKKISKLKISENNLEVALENELKILKKMSYCQNSVKFFCYYEENGYHIIIMELCDNELEKILNDKQNGFNSLEILQIMNGLNNALKYMNINGIIHRDLKLENIMIKYVNFSKSFIPKITDYGLSKQIGKGVTSTFCGSPEYMAPEILLGKKYDDKSDLWSIGIIIYKLLFKQRPFNLMNFYSPKEVEKELNTKKKKKATDSLLDDLLDKLLTFDPNKRMSWSEYFNHPFFNQGNNLISKFQQLNINNSITNNEKIINVYDYILEKMVIDSYTIKILNIRDIQIAPTKFISADDCLKFIGQKDDQFFILGVLAKYFEKIGISSLIEKDYIQRNEIIKHYHKTLLQFICNGYISKYKYLLHFSLSKDRRDRLIKDIYERSNFNEKIKNIMVKVYNLRNEELLITNHRIVNDQFTAIVIFKSNFNRNITKNELIQFFKYDMDLQYITIVEKELIIPSVRLNRSMLDIRGNNKTNNWRENVKIAGEMYYPPKGWFRYGINVANCYDNYDNSWIMSGHKKEWCISYCGFTGITKKINQIYENVNDSKHPGQRVGIGVYCYIKPEVMENNTETINIYGKQLKIGFMVRVKKNNIRCPENNNNVWIVNGNDDEFRPYGILIK